MCTAVRRMAAVVRSTVWRRYTSIVRHSPALLIRGILERGDGGVTGLLMALADCPQRR
jgi:hypothetical protein